jgi:hypothetical protein
MWAARNYCDDAMVHKLILFYPPSLLELRMVLRPAVLELEGWDRHGKHAHRL